MDESSSRFWIAKTFDKEKECVINSIPKSTVYRNKWALQIFRECKAKERTRFAPLTKVESSKDVQELTESIENKNAKSLN